MLSFSIEEHGKPGVLSTAIPAAPDAKELQIEVKTCGLNFADLLMQKGTYQDTPSLPFVPGLECAGRVTAVGREISDFKIGDRVAVFGGRNGLSQTACFPAERVTRLPDEVTMAEAAAVQIAYGTGLMALDTLARLKPGETLLVTGAAGGVGLTAVEIGKLLGARVIAHARGAEKLEIAKSAGADELIDAEDTDSLRDRVKALGGADVVYDAIGGDVWKEAFRATNPGGRLIPIGFAGGEVPQIPANHLLVKNLTVIGFYFGGYFNVDPEAVRATLRKLMSWCAEGKIRPHISHRLPLERTNEAFDLLRARKSTGKIVIEVSPEE